MTANITHGMFLGFGGGFGSEMGVVWAIGRPMSRLAFLLDSKHNVRYVFNRTMLQKDKSETTRRRIIEEAAELFAIKGFHGTSIADLSKAVGMTKGAIYHHFSGKDEILFGVVDYVKEQWSQYVAQAAMESTEPRQQLAILFAKQAQLMEERPILCLVINGLVIELDGSDDYLMRKIRNMYDAFALFLEQIVVQGQQQGQFRRDLDPRLVAVNIVGMIRGNSCSHVHNTVGSDFLKKMATLKEILLSGLGA